MLALGEVTGKFKFLCDRLNQTTSTANSAQLPLATIDLDSHSRQSRRERGISGGDSDDDDVSITADENMDGVEEALINEDWWTEENANDVDDDEIEDPWDSIELFDILRHINDPEHPLTLEQLNVIKRENIFIDPHNEYIKINFTPTIPHCSMATLIGLCIRVKLLRSVPNRFKIDVFITPGTHNSEAVVNKQLNDKERVAAALENGTLLGVINNCIAIK